MGWSPCVAVNTRTKLENAATSWPVAVTVRPWMSLVIGGYYLFSFWVGCGGWMMSATSWPVAVSIRPWTSLVIGG